MKRSLTLLAGIAFTAIALVSAADPPRKAPDLSFNIPGQGQKTLEAYRGKVVALEFIFTTCPHCQAASKIMSKFQQEYGSRGLQVIDVAVNQNADLLVENFVKDFQVSFPVGWTTSDKMTTFMGFPPSRFVVPQLALIDRSGTIRYQTPATEDKNWDNLMKEDTIRQHIEELLSASPNSASKESAGASHSGARKSS